MPLEKGSSKEVIGRNISEMVRAGHPQNQAIAASMRAAGKARDQKGAPKLGRSRVVSYNRHTA